jgi:hypothetical protein
LSFNCGPPSFDWSLYILDIFLISFLFIWFCLVFISNMVLILLIVVFFYHFLDLFFSILSLNILFHLFFCPNLVLILLITLFNHFLICFFFQFCPSIFYFINVFIQLWSSFF